MSAAVAGPGQFIDAVENTLGWSSTLAGPRWKVRKIEAGRVAKRVATNPALYTWPNLMLALELCRRERLPRAPLGVFAHVERALEMRRVPEHDLEERIRAAISAERANGDPDGWTTRFARAAGYYREEAYQQWLRTAS